MFKDVAIPLILMSLLNALIVFLGIKIQTAYVMWTVLILSPIVSAFISVFMISMVESFVYFVKNQLRLNRDYKEKLNTSSPMKIEGYTYRQSDIIRLQQEIEKAKKALQETYDSYLEHYGNKEEEFKGLKEGIKEVMNEGLK